jgi:hypothetical protein
MSLLTNFGLTPLSRGKKGKNGLRQSHLYVNVVNPGITYTLTVSDIVKNDGIEWEAMDIAFSKEHKGLFIAKGTTFPLKDKCRVNGKIIYETVWKGFCLKPVKTKANVLFTYELFSEDVYLLKLDSIDYNY